MLGPIAAGRPDVDQARGLPQTPDPKPQTRSLTPKEAAKLRILDPACGSGSFLIGAYQYLLDWHLDWYTNNEPDKWLKGKNPAIYQVGRTTDVAAGLRTGRQDVAAGLRTGRQDVAAGVPAGRTYRLTSSKRKEILLNNIYGVDIDPQAVEVTKLSLLLKVLEGETGEALNNQFRLFHERALPDLGDNIKCGNSLIGPDFYDHQQMLLLDDDEKLRINVFDWNKEFPDIMKSGGFDAVIGNPPYGFHQIHADYLKPYLKHRFVSSEGSFEHYFLFYERTLQLLRPTGRHGFIVPVTWLTIPSAASLRRFVLDSYAIEKLVWLPELVFRNAQVNTLISIISKKAADTVEVEIHDSLGFTSPAAETRMYPQKLFVDAGHYIGIFERPADSKIIERINEKSVPMSEVARPCSGYNPYEVGSGENPGGGPHTERTVEEKPYHSQRKLGPAWKPEIVGRDLARYAVTITGSRWVKYGPWLSAPRDPTNFVGKRLLVQEIVGGRERRIVAAYYDGELYHSRDVIPIKLEKEQPHPYYLLGIINSHLLTWYHHRRNPKAQKGLFPKVLVSDLKKLPVRQIDFSNRVDRANHDRMVSLVDQMLKLHERLAAAKPGHDRDAIQRQIDATDAQIDRLVYDLYALTEEEIKIVEETITK